MFSTPGVTPTPGVQKFNPPIMSTQKRELVPGEIYHVYNRGVDKKTIFHTDKDYWRFIEKMVELKQKCPIDMLAYCLMPNHFHLLVRVVQPQGLPQPQGSTNFLHRLFTSYAKYYDYYNEKHSGHVFEGRYKSKHVNDDEYYLKLCGYIHHNPVKKKLVKKPEEWPYSSYAALIGKRNDGISCFAPELYKASHQQIYRDFAKKPEDVLGDFA
jgi:putative transposase